MMAAVGTLARTVGFLCVESAPYTEPHSTEISLFFSSIRFRPNRAAQRPGTVGDAGAGQMHASGCGSGSACRMWGSASLRASVHGLPRRESTAPRRDAGAGCQDCVNTDGVSVGISHVLGILW
jgi:hypothetical protein